MKTSACAQCPWRLSNHGKRHPHGFYTKKNLQRLWNQIRNGGYPQSCHLTDPSHPDHIKVGAKPGAKAQECPGSVILIKRELLSLCSKDHEVDNDKLADYLRDKKHGLTKNGLRYWLLGRASQLAGTPFGDQPLPDVEEDPEIGLPEYLK